MNLRVARRHSGHEMGRGAWAVQGRHLGDGERASAPSTGVGEGPWPHALPSPPKAIAPPGITRPQSCPRTSPVHLLPGQALRLRG